MATTAKPLYVNQPGTSASSLYTTPASTTTIIKTIIICNTTGSEAKLRLYVVPSGQTAGVAYAIVYDRPIAAYDTVVLDLSTVMTAGYFIAGSQTTSGALSVNISGVEVA